MRNFNSFHITVTAVVVLGLAAAIVAALGETRWAVAIGGLGLAALALLFLYLDRRTQAAARQARRSADQARQAVGRISGDVRRVESLVDAMQRRVVASLESARVEAATRHRDTPAAK